MSSGPCSAASAAPIAVTVNIILPPAGNPAYQCGLGGEVRATVTITNPMGVVISAVQAIFDGNGASPYAMQKDNTTSNEWSLRPIPALGLGPHNVKVRVTYTVPDSAESGNVQFSCFMM